MHLNFKNGSFSVDKKNLIVKERIQIFKKVGNFVIVQQGLKNFICLTKTSTFQLYTLGRNCQVVLVIFYYKMCILIKANLTPKVLIKITLALISFRYTKFVLICSVISCFNETQMSQR